MKSSSEVFLYLVMGVLTTVLNVISFFIFIQIQMDYRVATTIAWIISVIFAYITNKRYVFHSVVSSIKKLFREIFSFFWVRLLSYFVDLGSMILLISTFKTNETIAKIIANVIVIIINYAFSKWFIFKPQHEYEK